MSSEKAVVVEQEISLLGLASILFRWRYPIIALGLLGGIFGLARALTSPRVYTSDTIFIPQGAEPAATGLAAAASQLGMRVPQGGGSWGPPAYIELLKSRALLEPIADDTVVVTEQNGRRVALMDLFEVDVPSAREKKDVMISALQGTINTAEVVDLGGVKVSVTTLWPSVSHTLAERIVRGVNQFNVETRKSQAAAERAFVEEQAREAEYALRNAEARLESFLLRNRETFGSPVLAAERDRLQRDMTLRQELHTSWLKAREDARIREVRDTPVITVFEEPQVPYIPRPRNTMQKGVLGGLMGGIIGVMLALLAHGLARARRVPSPDAAEFFQLLDNAKPKFLRRNPR